MMDDPNMYAYGDHYPDDSDQPLPLPPEGHPLRKLGQRLTELLDEDHWAECERLLLEGWGHDRIDRKTADELREQIKGMQGMLASLGRARGLLVELDSVLRMAESHNGGALTAAHVRAAVEPYLPLDLGPNVEFSGVPVGHSINHPAGGTSAATQG